MQVAGLIDLPIQIAVLLAAQSKGRGQGHHLMCHLARHEELHMAGSQHRLNLLVEAGGHGEFGLLQLRSSVGG